MHLSFIFIGGMIWKAWNNYNIIAYVIGYFVFNYGYIQVNGTLLSKRKILQFSNH